MRKLLLGLLILLVILQLTLWFGGGGLLELWEQHQEVEAQRDGNARLRERNEALNAEAVASSESSINGVSQVNDGIVSEPGNAWIAAFRPKRSWNERC